ncbi:60S ribosomal protein L29 [Fonsecaea pedrosoi]|nr:60S ribosomal protein L29 [Fonsecaea pedrosoi]
MPHTFDNLDELLERPSSIDPSTQPANLYDQFVVEGVKMAKSKNSSQHNQAKKAHKNGYEFRSRREYKSPCLLYDRLFTKGTDLADISVTNRIKKPKTFRYPSLKGTDPKFRRNHKHALHGTMKALKEVREGKRDAA